MTRPLASVVLLVAAAVAAGQSHVPVPAAEGNPKPSHLLARRLGDLQRGKQLQSLVEKLPPEFQNPLTRAAIQRALSDPDFREKLAGIDLGDPNLRAMIGGMNLPQFQGMSPEQVTTKLAELKRMLADRSPPTPVAAAPPKAAPPKAVPAPALSPEQAEQQRILAERMAEWAKAVKLDRLPEGLRDSPTLRDTLDGLRGIDLSRPGMPLPGVQQGLADQLGKLKPPEGAWERWLPTSLPPLDFSALPRPHWPLGQPNVSLPQMPNGPAFGSPNVGAPSGATLSAGLIALGGVALLVLLWRLPARIAARAQAAKIGPWPVDPRHLQSPADVVKAWEYLAEKHLGEPALYSHHVAHAAGLDAKVPAHAEDVGALAGLYEQARYAPGEPALTAEQVAAARDHFGRVAGAGSV